MNEFLGKKRVTDASPIRFMLFSNPLTGMGWDDFLYSTRPIHNSHQQHLEQQHRGLNNNDNDDNATDDSFEKSRKRGPALK